MGRFLEDAQGSKQRARFEQIAVDDVDGLCVVHAVYHVDGLCVVELEETLYKLSYVGIAAIRAGKCDQFRSPKLSSWEYWEDDLGARCEPSATV